MQVEWWTKEIRQPKHVVLTARNTDILSKNYLVWLKAQFSKLRRQKVFRSVRGGFYSLEVTNEGRGWHVHLHILADANWIDARELAIVWGKLLGQDFAIVKVKDARGESYLKEVTKYAVKGNDLASWSGEEIATFIRAFAGVRTFGVFGSLYGKRTEFAEWIAVVREIKTPCACGCTEWRVISEWEYVTEAQAAPRAPPAENPQREWKL